MHACLRWERLCDDVPPHLGVPKAPVWGGQGDTWGRQPVPPQSQGAWRHRAGSAAPCGHPTCPAPRDPAHVGFPSVPLGHWTWWRGPWLPKCPAPLGDLGLLRAMAPGGLAGLGARLGRWPRAGGSWAPRHEAGWHCRLGGVAVSLSGDSGVPGGKDPSVPGMCLALLAGDPLRVRGSAVPPLGASVSPPPQAASAL